MADGRRGRGTEPGGDVNATSAAELREALRRNLVRPLDLVMLTRDRIEEVLDDAVKRGRMTADDAQELAAGLLERGRRQTDDVLRDLEALLARSRDELGDRAGGARRAGGEAARAARSRVEGAARAARDRGRGASDAAALGADRAPGGTGAGAGPPIVGYEELTAQEVQARLDGLSPATLRRVRDYERRHANRKSVLAAVDRRLA